MSEAVVEQLLDSKEADARAYLEATLMPVLVQALDSLCRDRPENPVDYVAMYLLKRTPKRNITVEVPLSATAPAAPGAPASSLL